MLWLPTVRELTLNTALPVLSRGTVPIAAVPSENVTLPDGVPDPPLTAVTTAIKVTG